MSPLEAIVIATIVVLLVLVAVGVWRHRKQCWTIVAEEPQFVVLKSKLKPAHPIGTFTPSMPDVTRRLVPGRGASWGEIATPGVPQGSAWAPGTYF